MDGAIARSGGWWAPKFVLAAVAAVLAMRAVYLLRFGWDPGWMGYAYLHMARSIALSQLPSMEWPPLTPLIEVALRRLGAGALAAQTVTYLGAHLLLLAGTLGLASVVWPEASARRRAILALTVALTPLLSSESGRNNLGALVAAALATCSLALAASAAARVRASPARLALAVLCGALAGCARYEGLATCAAGAVVFAAVGGRLRGLQRHLSAAAALALAAGLGLLATLAIRRALTGAALAGESLYGFYTFYDGLPFAMFPKVNATEYDRYRASAAFFGTFAENQGSVVRALLAHPGAALLRLATKQIDLLAALLWVHGLTPIGVAALVSGARALRPSPGGAHRAWLLLAWLGPLALLQVPPPNPAYFLALAPPLLLGIGRGVDRWTSGLSSRQARRRVALACGVTAALLASAGKLAVTNSRALNDAAVWLESRCAGGCLANFVPQSISRQAWVDLEAGAPLPTHRHQSEQSILGQEAPAPETVPCRFCDRVRLARAGGFAGPVLYVESRIASFTAIDPTFDVESTCQGEVDLSTFSEERRFRRGADEVVVHRLPPDQPCLDELDGPAAGPPLSSP